MNHATEFLKSLENIEGPVSLYILSPRTADSSLPPLLLFGDVHPFNYKCIPCPAQTCSSFYDDTLLNRLDMFAKQQDTTIDFFGEFWYLQSKGFACDNPLQESALCSLSDRPFLAFNLPNIRFHSCDVRKISYTPFEIFRTSHHKADQFIYVYCVNLYKKLKGDDPAADAVEISNWNAVITDDSGPSALTHVTGVFLTIYILDVVTNF